MRVPADNFARTSFAALQRFVRQPAQKPDRCELCAVPIESQHSHLLELHARRVTCSCEACAILFSDNTRQSYRRIPREVTPLEDFAIDDHEWDSLLIPIKLAFFVHDSASDRVVAQYPSPGGAMECALDLEYWSAIVEHNPVLKQFAPDVEALLINRISDPPRYYRAPIDSCYRLVGILRSHWRGLSGGPEVWRKVEEFFQRLNPVSGGSHA